MKHGDHRREALAWLLLRLFRPTQLRAFVSVQAPSIAPHLPDPSVSPAAFASQAATHLVRQGFAGPNLFSALRQARPRQEELIAHVERAFVGGGDGGGLSEEAVCEAERLIASPQSEDWERAARLALASLPPSGRPPDERTARVAKVLRLARERLPLVRGSLFLVAATALMRELRLVLRSPWTIGGSVVCGFGAATLYFATEEDSRPVQPQILVEHHGDDPGDSGLTDRPEAGAPPPEPAPQAERLPRRTRQLEIGHRDGRPASDHSSHRGENEECVRSMVWNAYPDGWAVRTIASVGLAEGEHHIFVTTLYAHNEYRLIACGERGMTNVDIVLYDADGRLITQDEDDGRQPTLRFAPEITDDYYIALQNADPEPRGTPHGVSLAVTYR